MRLSYLYDGNPYMGKKAYLYWNGPIVASPSLHVILWCHYHKISNISADRRCSNYIWVINNIIAYQSASYIRLDVY